jgi:hypothetical protein
MEGESKMTSKCGLLFHRILVTRKMNIRRNFQTRQENSLGKPPGVSGGATSVQHRLVKREEPFTVLTGREVGTNSANTFEGQSSLRVKLEAVRPTVKVLRIYDLEDKNRPVKKAEPVRSCPRFKPAGNLTLDTNQLRDRGQPGMDFSKQMPQKSYRDLSRERVRLANLEYQPGYPSVKEHLPLIFIPKSSRRVDEKKKALLGCNSFFLDVNIDLTRDSRLQNTLNFKKCLTRKGMENKRVCLNDDFHSGLDHKGVGEGLSKRRFGEFCKSQRVLKLSLVGN